jgi:hypothetical protein
VVRAGEYFTSADGVDKTGSAFFNAANVRDVGMVLRSQNLSLALEASHAIGVACENLRQYLQRDIPLQPGITSAIHLAHAAHADRSELTCNTLRIVLTLAPTFRAIFG